MSWDANSDDRQYNPGTRTRRRLVYEAVLGRKVRLVIWGPTSRGEVFRPKRTLGRLVQGEALDARKKLGKVTSPGPGPILDYQMDQIMATVQLPRKRRRGNREENLKKKCPLRLLCEDSIGCSRFEKGVLI